MIRKVLIQQVRLSIFSILITGLVFVSIENAECRQNKKILSTITTGTQAVDSELSPEMKKNAETAARRSAVERAVADLLSLEEFASGFKILDAKILANPSEYIGKYRVIAELREKAKYVVAVETRVNLTLLKKHLKKYGIIKSKKEKPSVLLLISEKTEQDILPQYWWGKNPLPYESLVADEIIQFLIENGFDLAGHNAGAVDLKKYGVVFNTIYDTSAALKLGKKFKADIVVMGKAESFEALNKMGEEKTYEADIALDMLSVSTHKKIGTLELKTATKNFNSDQGNKSVLKKIGKLAAKEITLKADKYWGDNILKKEQRIETRIKGENYLSSFILLRKALNDMPEVKSVQTKELGADQAIVSIIFKGSADKLAQALLLKTFDSFGIEIYDVAKKSFTIKFVSR